LNKKWAPFNEILEQFSNQIKQGVINGVKNGNKNFLEKLKETYFLNNEDKFFKFLEEQSLMEKVFLEVKKNGRSDILEYLFESVGEKNGLKLFDLMIPQIDEISGRDRHNCIIGIKEAPELKNFLIRVLPVEKRNEVLQFDREKGRNAILFPILKCGKEADIKDFRDLVTQDVFLKYIEESPESRLNNIFVRQGAKLTDYVLSLAFEKAEDKVEKLNKIWNSSKFDSSEAYDENNVLQFVSLGVNVKNFASLSCHQGLKDNAKDFEEKFTEITDSRNFTFKDFSEFFQSCRDWGIKYSEVVVSNYFLNNLDSLDKVDQDVLWELDYLLLCNEKLSPNLEEVFLQRKCERLNDELGLKEEDRVALKTSLNSLVSNVEGVNFEVRQDSKTLGLKIIINGWDNNVKGVEKNRKAFAGILENVLIEKFNCKVSDIAITKLENTKIPSKVVGFSGKLPIVILRGGGILGEKKS
jgi:ribosomal protein L20A (L18A)